MAVSVIAGSLQVFEQSNSGSYTVPAGSNRLVVLFACGEDPATDRTITSLAIGGQNATLIDRSTGEAATFPICGIGYLTEAQIAAGSLESAHTAAVTWSTTPTGNYWLAVLTLAGVNQGSPVTDTDLNNSNTRGVYPTTTKTITLDTNTVDGLLLAAAVTSAPTGWATTPTGEGWTNQYNSPIPVGGPFSSFAISTIAATGASDSGTYVATDASNISLFGIAFAPSGGSTPTITNADDEQYYAGETGIVITGTNFGASQGSNGRVYLSPTDDVDDAGRVSQTITAWSATSITFTATLGSLSLDTNLYLFVLADSTESNAAGYVVQIVARPFIRDTLIGLNGAAVASETGMTMLVYHSVPATAVAPAQVITGVSTNSSGQLDQVINRGALALNAPVWLILMKDGSPAKATARKVTPVYE